MNMICRSLLVLPPVAPKVRSTEVGFTSKNTLRILSTIKPVIRAFTAMDNAKLMIINGSKGRAEESSVVKKFIPIDPSTHLSIIVHISAFEGELPVTVN